MVQVRYQILEYQVQYHGLHAAIAASALATRLQDDYVWEG